MLRKLSQFFFPPSESSARRKLAPYVILGAVTIVILLAIPPAWAYTNSPAFCGTTCHTMPPEYSTYLASPHARVPCVDCHLGRGILAQRFFRKAGDLKHVVKMLFANYHYPIKAGEMRPARESCERCHFPEKFSDDSLRTINRFDNNRSNDPSYIYLAMHTGGGSQREGLGKGIHWHVENPITYIATDREHQEIPWIRVEHVDGTFTDYNAINSPIDVDNLEQYDTHEMDCITCHNRISHSIETPISAVDAALNVGMISQDIPFIRSRAVDLLTVTYPTTDAAQEAFNDLDEYYATNYPEYYEQGSEEVHKAIAHLETLYAESNFPEQLLDWSTHPNNIGHKESPGCFRCHDGQHFSEAGEAVRLECNLCHSIPVVASPDVIEPTLPLSTGLEPTSHLDSSWIARHRNVYDASCSNCHTTSNPGGTDNSSFCSNSACHGTKWRFAGFDAPGLATMLGIYQTEPEPLLMDFEGEPTYDILKPLFVQECGGCHGPVPSKGLRVTDYASFILGSESRAVVVPGEPDASPIVDVLESGHFAKFNDVQMELLKQWIANGAPEA